MLQICFQSEKNGLILRDTVRNSENTFRISGMGAEKVQNSCFLSVNNKWILCHTVQNSENMFIIFGFGAENIQNFSQKIRGWSKSKVAQKSMKWQKLPQKEKDKMYISLDATTKHNFVQLWPRSKQSLSLKVWTKDNTKVAFNTHHHPPQ